MNDGQIGLLVMTLDGAPHLLRNTGRDQEPLANGGAQAGQRQIRRHRRPRHRDDQGERKPFVQIHDVIPVVGYLSQSDPRPHFGLGQATQAESVEIRWPDGTVTKMTDVPADQFLKVVQEKSK